MTALTALTLLVVCCQPPSFGTLPTQPTQPTYSTLDRMMLRQYRIEPDRILDAAHRDLNCVPSINWNNASDDLLVEEYEEALP